MSLYKEQLILSMLDNKKNIITDISNIEVIIDENNTHKKKILSLPYDILKLFCSLCPILGLTCKELNALCPIKPNKYFYEKLSKWHLPIIYIYTGIPYYYYHFNVNCILPIIESKKFITLNISVPYDLVEIVKIFKYICENNIPYNDFKYKKELDDAIYSNKNSNSFIHMEKYDSIATSFLMYLYH